MPRAIGEQIVQPLFPLVWEAFVDYRLEGLFLSRLEREVIARLMRTARRQRPSAGHGRGFSGRAGSLLGRAASAAASETNAAKSCEQLQILESAKP